jgi:hypothetical protein
VAVAVSVAVAVAVAVVSGPTEIRPRSIFQIRVVDNLA